MGLPAQQTDPSDVAPPKDAPQSPSATNEPTGSAPSNPSALPSEALELAAKLFDYARNGSTPELLQYVGAGIPANLTNHTGDSLLMLASYHGHVETTKALLDKGADPNAVNGRGQSIIAGAVFKGYADVVRALVEGGADPAAGQPSARDCARMFKREDLFGVLGVEA